MTVNRIRTRSRLALILAALALGAIILAACGGSDESTTGSDTASGSVTVSDAWARTSAMSQENGAAYMKITAGAGGDVLLAASAPTDIAAKTEIHETVMAEDTGDGMSDMTTEEDMGSMDGEMDGMGDAEDMGSMTGAMTMQQVDRIEIPADSTVALEPGGYHVMMLGLSKPLEVGQTFDLTLTFEKAGEQVVTVEVRES